MRQPLTGDEECAGLAAERLPVEALHGPFPTLKLMPTGGVHAANAADYIAAGAAALGVGSELVDPAELAAGQTANLRERARSFRQAITSARAALPKATG